MEFQVDAEHSGLGNAEVAGDAGGYVDLLSVRVLALQIDHAKDGGALRNVGQRDHRPQHRTAEVGDQLLDGVRHVMQAGDDQRGINKTEDCAKDHAEGAGNASVDNIRDDGADLPADGAKDGMSDDDGQDQRAERYNDHRDDRRADLAEEFFQIHQRERGQHGRDNLCLVADHVDGEEAEIPLGDICRCCGCDRVGVQQLAGNKRQAEDDAQALGRAHLFRDGPADADRQHVENGLADQPQEAVHAGPELADVAQRLGAVIKKVDAVNAVAEAENQTAGDDGGDQRGKNLSQHTHDLLQRVLVLLGRALDSLLGDTVDAGDRDEIIVEIVDRVADDDLELARLGESALGGFQCLDLGNVRLGGIVEDKSHTRYAVGYCRNVLFAANVLKQLPRVLFVFTHDVFLLLPGRAGIFELVHTSSSYSHRIPDLFIQVNMLLQKSSAVRLFSALLTSCPLENQPKRRYTKVNV